MLSNTMREDIKQAIQKNKNWIICLSGLSSVFSNICEPIAPFCKYLLIAATIVTIITLTAYFALKNLRLKLLPILLFAIFTAFVSGTLYGLQFNENNNRGFLANTIPGIGKLQDSLGLISKDISEIKETTIAIKEDTSEIKKATSSIDSKMDVVIDKVGKQGGIISSPNTPEDFYHNARIYELNGDYGNARRAYINYFKNNTHKLDPHLRFQAFLKIEEGISGAREIYDEMFSESNNTVDKYALILLKDKDSRKNELISFAQQNPDFGPVFFELAKQYSKANVGKQSLTDLKQEKDYVDKYLQAYDQGKVTKYYIDKEIIDKNLKYIKEREVELKKIDTNTKLSMERFYGNNKQWNINVSLNDIQTEFFYRIDGKGDFISTGFSEMLDPRTGKPYAITYISLPPGNEPKEYIEFKYLDINGNQIGPIKLNWINKTSQGKDLDPIIESGINFCKKRKAYWVSFLDNWDGNSYLYFNCLDDKGIEKIFYGINKDVPDTELKGEFSHNNPNYRMKITPDFEKISLQLFFLDDTKSEVEVFYKK